MSGLISEARGVVGSPWSLLQSAFSHRSTIGMMKLLEFFYAVLVVLIRFFLTLTNSVH